MSREPRVVVSAHACVRDLDDFPWSKHGIRSRDRKPMSRHMQLAVAAALRCREQAGATADAWEDLPVFLACPTGREISLPFVEAAQQLPEHERSKLCPAVFAQGGVNILDFLKGSAGTIAGYVAKYAGARGLNASSTGYGADFFALQKASLLLRHGEIAQALVVGGESGRETPGASASAPEAGAALLLTCKPIAAARAIAVEQDTTDPTMNANDDLEAIPLLVRIAEHLARRTAGDLRTIDPYGRAFRARVEAAIEHAEAAHA